MEGDSNDGRFKYHAENKNIAKNQSTKRGRFFLLEYW